MHYRENEVNYKDTFIYDTQNHLIEKIEYLSDTNFYWHRLINYDLAGMKVDSICYFYWSPNFGQEAISIHNEEQYNFDKHGNLIKQLYKRSNIIVSEINSTYNEENELIKEVITYPNEQTIRKSYDKYGNVKIKEVFNNQDSLISKESFEIEYDLEKNITKIVALKDGKIQGTHNRSYQYYEN